MSAGAKVGLISMKLKRANSSVADARRTEHSLLRSARLFQLVCISPFAGGLSENRIHLLFCWQRVEHPPGQLPGTAFEEV